MDRSTELSDIVQLARRLSTLKTHSSGETAIIGLVAGALHPHRPQEPARAGPTQAAGEDGEGRGGRRAWLGGALPGYEEETGKDELPIR